MCEETGKLEQLVKAVVERGKELLDAYNAGVDAKTKEDGTSLTEMDRKIGKQLKTNIEAVYGENQKFLVEDAVEQGKKFQGNEWVIDPIDGTALFKDQVPTFGISVAKFAKKAESTTGKEQSEIEPVIGIFYMPAMKGDGVLYEREDGETIEGPGHLYVAASGKGAQFNGNKLCMPSIPRDPQKGWRDSYIAVSSDGHRYRFAFEGKIRAFGASAFHLALVSRGLLVGAFFTRFKLWDIAAGAVIVKEAGGDLCSLKTGGPIDFADHDQGRLPSGVLAAHKDAMPGLLDCFVGSDSG